ncbi:caspase Nc-like, partial [Asbolus verrucosus]
EEDKYHNNRRILFKILDYKKCNVFPILLESLKDTGFIHLADNLGNKFVTAINSNLHPLEVNVDVKLSTKFYDTETYNNTSFYITRSKNRGHVLIINNIKFSSGNEERHGAELDERNLRELFEKMGLKVVAYTDLTAYEMYVKTKEFSESSAQITPPDMGIIIIMSHGVVHQNETMIISSDNKLVPEDHFRQIFNNENCPLFRKKPKIFIYHICRSILKEPVNADTMTDANLSERQRTYSDMLICHPSVKGFAAHRNNIKGSWYIQLLCKVFMNFAHEMDIETLLKKVDEELEIVSSLPWKMEDMSHKQENLIYKHFVELEEDRRHNNRCILFQFLKLNSTTVFHELTECLREHKFDDLANKLENKPPISALKALRHRTCCFKLPDNFCDETYENIPTSVITEQLKIDVKYATEFCDNEDCYRIRSKNRGQVLIINNIHFDSELHQTRRGAEVDESNLKDLFEKIGFSIDMYRNLTKEEIEGVTEKFAQKRYETPPDMGIVIIMSHGEKVDNKTVIIGSDGNGVEEEWIIRQFNNQSCVLFKNRPKVLIFNICRGELVDNLVQFAQHTQSDSACTKKPDILDDDERYYSDLIICHPSVEGFQAHRDTVRGCWYIELLCKVFMEKSFEMDVESMLKMVERGLKTRISEKRTRQTSTFLNIAFRTCYLNPGIYEEDGIIEHFKQSL